jgi:hypothetical protein
MSESDVPREGEPWQKPARLTKRRAWLILSFVVVVVLAVVVYLKLTEKHAHLTAVDRATGAQRWRDKLPAPAAATLIRQQDAELGIGACGRGAEGSWIVVDPSTGKVLPDRDWRPADGNPPLVSVWIDPSTVGDPTAVPEFSYDSVSGSLVSVKGWSIKVHVSGYPRHIPILVVGDSVYFIENAKGCGPGGGGGG